MRAYESPFATDRVEKLLYYRPEWSGTSWESLEKNWEELGFRASLVGRHGAGKTTLMDAWAKRLISKGQKVVRFFLNKESSSTLDWKLFADCDHKFIFLDGEEQLSWFERRKFYQRTKHAKGLLVTRHRSGVLPTMCELKPSIEILSKCLLELDSNLTEFPDIEEWWKLDKSNVREILLRCYDHCRTKL